MSIAGVMEVKVLAGIDELMVPKHSLMVLARSLALRCSQCCKHTFVLPSFIAAICLMTEYHSRYFPGSVLAVLRVVNVTFACTSLD